MSTGHKSKSGSGGDFTFGGQRRIRRNCFYGTLTLFFKWQLFEAAQRVGMFESKRIDPCLYHVAQQFSTWISTLQTEYGC